MQFRIRTHPHTPNARARRLSEAVRRWPYERGTWQRVAGWRRDARRMHPQRARSVHATPKSAHIRTPPTRARGTCAGARAGRSGIGPESGAPGSGFRNATGLPPRQALVSNPRAWRTHRRGRSQAAKRRAPRRHGSRSFRRAASRRMADMDSGPGTRSVRVMAGHMSSQGVGRSAGTGSVLAPSSVCSSQDGRRCWTW